MLNDAFNVPLRDGATIHGREVSVAGGPVLCMVAGLSGEGAFWDPVVPALARRFRLVLHDHRGTGHSTRSRIDYSIDQMADDLLQVMDARGLREAVIVGHSTGGAIAQSLALCAPRRVRGVVLSATWAGPDAYFSTLFELRLQVLRSLGQAAHAKLGALVRDDPAHLSYEPATIEESEESADILAHRLAALLAYDRRADLAFLEQPAHVVCAADDRVAPPHLSHELAQRLPDASLALLDDGGHFAPRTRAEAWLAAVEPFLARVAA